jgi:hypothetical protein
MTDLQFAVIWILSFGLYFLIYTFWIPAKTQKRIENWLRDSESDDTLLEALEVIVKRIREQILFDFEEFMLPEARKNLQSFWAGAMGNAAKEFKKSDEGGKLSLISNMASELEGSPWYVQAAASQLIPVLEKAANKGPKAATKQFKGMGLQK